MAAADCTTASIAQLAERTLRKRTVVGSIPTGGFYYVKARELEFCGANTFENAISTRFHFRVTFLRAAVLSNNGNAGV